MQSDVLEELVISGKLFNAAGDYSPPRQQSPSASRSPSPDPFPVEPSSSSYVGTSGPARPVTPPHKSIGMGPGRTGVKGVIRDRDEARERELAKAFAERASIAEKQKHQDFSAKTYFEETEPTQKREGDAWGGVEDWRQRRLEELKAEAANGGSGKYGHLREVGLSGYIEAVERVPREVWVVLHIYDASLGRCAILDSHLSSLARRYPTVKFLRARAGAIGFATSSATSSLSPGIAGSQPQTNIRREAPRTKYRDPDESGSEDDAPSNLVGAYPRQDEDDLDEDDGNNWEPEPDYDVLPTMLVYRGGELLFNWPRVDWEVAAAAGKGGSVEGGPNAIDARDVEALLTKHHIIPLSSTPAGGSSSDLEDEGELEFASDVE